MHIAICNTFFVRRQINLALKSNIMYMVHMKNCTIMVIDLSIHDKIRHVTVHKDGVYSLTDVI